MRTDYISVKSGVAAAALIVAGAAGASAATLDFTDSNAYDARSAGGASGTLMTLDPTAAPVIWTLSTDDGDLTYQDFDGTGASTGLAEEFDGVGVNDDEVNNDGGSESLTLAFSEEVNLTGFHFLDLFVRQDGEEREQAIVSVDGGEPLIFDAVETYQDNAGYLFAEQAVTGQVFTFTSSMFNDGVVLPDFALAGIEYNPDDLTNPGGGVAPIPLPAGAILLGSGLAAFGALRRRKA